MIFGSASCPAYAWTLFSPPPGEVCEVAVEQLWGDYLIIGGSMSLFWFQLCLDVDAFADQVEHDLIAQVLGEHLLEHGHRFPVPYLRHRPTGDADPTARPPQR